MCLPFCHTFYLWSSGNLPTKSDATHLRASLKITFNGTLNLSRKGRGELGFMGGFTPPPLRGKGGVRVKLNF